MCIFCKWFKKLCGSNYKCKCHCEKGAEANKVTPPITPTTHNNQTNSTASETQIK